MNVIITGAAGGFGRRFGATVVIRACDLTEPASVDTMFAFIDSCGIRFDMLLNIAGLDHEGTFTSRSCEQLAAIVALNDVATVRVTHSILWIFSFNGTGCPVRWIPQFRTNDTGLYYSLKCLSNPYTSLMDKSLEGSTLSIFTLYAS